MRKAGVDYSTSVDELAIRMLSVRPMTAAEMAAETGRSYECFRLWTTRNRDKIHIVGWPRSCGNRAARYALGPGDDVPRPPKMSNSEKNIRYRATEGGKLAHSLARERWHKSERGQQYRQSYQKAYYARQKARQGGLAAFDPLLAAIMGIRAPAA